MIDIDQIGAAAFIVAMRDDESFVYERMNPATEQLTGLSARTTVGRSPAEVFSPEAAAVLVANYRECIARRETVEVEQLVVVPRGEIVTRTTLTPLLDAPDLPVRRLLGVSVDTTEQHRLREDLHRSNARLAVAVDALGGAPWFFDMKDRAFEFSAGFHRILGVELPRQVSVAAWLEHVHPEDRDDTCFAEILAGRREQGTAEFRVIANDGDVRWLRCRRRAVAVENKVAGIVGIVIDVTQEKRREHALSMLAASDALTGLANRRRFAEVLDDQRTATARAGSALSVIMIDVDHFKLYNDTYGHVAGDGVLRVLARCFDRLVTAAGGLAARFGGEEFVAVLPALDAVAAEALAEAILAEIGALRMPHAASALGRVSVSIGVASQAPDQAMVDLVLAADTALYRAKLDGRNCCRSRVAPVLGGMQQPAASAA